MGLVEQEERQRNGNGERIDFADLNAMVAAAEEVPPLAHELSTSSLPAHEHDALFATEDDRTAMSQIIAAQKQAIKQDYPKAQVFYLGKGTQGLTYKVVCDNGDVLTAKVRGVFDITAEQALRELKIYKVLTHPNLCAYRTESEHYDRGIHITYYEYAEGISLDKLLKDRTKLPTEMVTSIVKQLAEALDYCHSPGSHPDVPHAILHRDLKPSNIIVSFSESGEPLVKLIDFGIAKLHTETITMHKIPVGTESYMAPEARSFRYAPESDQYSLGVVAIQCLLGEIPEHLKNQKSNVAYTIPAALGATIPSALKDVLHQLVRSEREARFEDCKALLTALGDVTKGATKHGELPSLSQSGGDRTGASERDKYDATSSIDSTGTAGVNVIAESKLSVVALQEEHQRLTERIDRLEKYVRKGERRIKSPLWPCMKGAARVAAFACDGIGIFAGFTGVLYSPIAIATGDMSNFTVAAALLLTPFVVGVIKRLPDRLDEMDASVWGARKRLLELKREQKQLKTDREAP
jgi:serine/threonine protein kinase